METLAMSVRERRRLEVFHRVATRELTLVKASELLSLSYRQTKRVYARYRGEGDSKNRAYVRFVASSISTINTA